MHDAPHSRRWILMAAIAALVFTTAAFGQSQITSAATTQPTAVAGSVTTIGRGAEVRTAQDGVQIQCDGGGEVYVFNTDVVLTGECRTVAIKASGVSVEIAETRELDVYSDGNSITAESATEVDIYGSNNTIHLGTASAVDFTGSDNKVTFATGSPDIDDEGQRNEAIQADAPAQEGVASTSVSRGRETSTTSDGAIIYCDGGGDVYVQHTDVTVTGSCQAVSIKTPGVTVTVETTIELDLYGDDAIVTADAVRELDIKGNGNTVTVGSVREIDFEGSNNTVTVESGTPDIDDEGQNNTVT